MITCHDTVAWLLAAEPSELAATSNLDISTHLDSCPRCRRRVARVSADTAWLARVVNTRSQPATLHASHTQSAPSRHSRRRSDSFVPALLAASLVAVLVPYAIRGRNQLHQEAAKQVAAVSTVAAAPAMPVATEAGAPSTAGAGPTSTPATPATPATSATPARQPAVPARLPAAQVIAPVPLLASFTPPTAAQAVRLDSLPGEASAHIEARTSVAVDVEPTSDRRFAVLRSDPKVTVVWFY